jgi:RHS repeat-associated protein
LPETDAEKNLLQFLSIFICILSFLAYGSLPVPVHDEPPLGSRGINLGGIMAIPSAIGVGFFRTFTNCFPSAAATALGLGLGLFVPLAALAAEPELAARDDRAITPIATPIVIPVLANDTSVSGQPLAVSAISRFPAHGVAEIAPDATTVFYTPDADFTGEDSFAYAIADGTLSAEASVTIVVTRYHGTLGSILAIAATDLPGFPDVEFTRKPAVKASYLDPVKNRNLSATLKVLTKVSSAKSAETVDCEWTKTIPLQNPKTASATLSTAENLALRPLLPLLCELRVKAQGRNKAKYDALDAGDFCLYPPTITGITDIRGNPADTGAQREQFILRGTFFGGDAPAVWLEYKKSGVYKAKKVKVLKPYAFADVAGRAERACMDPADGASEIRIEMPPSWPSGWSHSEPHNLVLDNGIGLSTIPFNTAHKDINRAPKVRVAAENDEDSKPLPKAGGRYQQNLPDTTVQLKGEVVDDNLPLGRKMSLQWTQVAGPPGVALATPRDRSTLATFPGTTAAGRYTFRLTADDGALYDAVGFAELTIDLNLPGNFAPVVEAGPDQIVTLEADFAEVTTAATATDDGWPARPDYPGHLDYTWTQIAGPSAAAIANADQLDTTITFRRNGIYLFRLMAHDGELSSMDAFMVRVNLKPEARDDMFATPVGEPLTVLAKDGLLVNDIDRDGDPLTARLAAAPAHGAVTIGLDGAFTYTPDPAYNGLDAFTYVANDGVIDSEPATVELSCAQFLYVDKTTGNDANDGLTPATAKRCLRPAFNLVPGVLNGREYVVHVAPGYYDEGADQGTLYFSGRPIKMIAEGPARTLVSTCFNLDAANVTPAWIIGFGFQKASAISGRGSVHVRNCRFECTSSTLGAGIYMYGNLGNTDVTVEDCTFAHCQAKSGNGGAIYMKDSRNVVVRRCRFVACFATLRGGAAYLLDNSQFLFEDCQFIANKMTGLGHGGAVGVERGQAIFRHCTFDGNESPKGSGGAVYVDGPCAGGVVFADCEFRNSSAKDSGGAIFARELNAGELHLVGSRFENNRINQTGRYGGALHITTTDTAEILACEFRKNAAPGGEGGAISINGGGDTTIDTCLFVRNVADQGNAIYLSGANHELAVVQTTITRNSVTDTDSALHCAAGDIKVRRSIVWDRMVDGGTSATILVEDSCLRDTAFSGPRITYDDPLLTRGGWMTDDSICHDIDPEGLAGDDIHGDFRPTGAGLDFGCDEFSDSDGDRLPDWWEYLYGGDLDPDEDLDEDGYSNLDEYLNDLNPLRHDIDADSDGLDDWWEWLHFGTLAQGPNDDPDGDGLNNLDEARLGTDPNSADTDGDGLSDGAEVNVHHTNPLVADSDGDGMDDGDEVTNGLDPNDKDSDNDNLPDGWEFRYFGNLAQGPNDDPDDDGLTNLMELIYGTNPMKPDTDDDGTNDGDEADQGSNPGDSGDNGERPPTNEVCGLALTIGDFSGSHSERYNLIVGPVVHQAPTFGEVETSAYRVFRTNKTYAVSIVHTGSNLSPPDYDYVAFVSAEFLPEGVSMEIEDPDQILGYHYESDYFYAAGKKAYVHLFRPVDIDVDSDNDRTITDNDDGIEAMSPGLFLAVNDNDTDEDGKPDCENDEIDGYRDQKDMRTVIARQLRLPDGYADKSATITWSGNAEVRLFRKDNQAHLPFGTNIISDLCGGDLELWAEGVSVPEGEDSGEATLTLYTDTGRSDQIQITVTKRSGGGGDTPTPRGKYRGIDLHGLPVAEKKPQEEAEYDQPQSRFEIDAFSLLPSYSATDISLAVGPELCLEFRRSHGLAKPAVDYSTYIVQNIPKRSAQQEFILGPGWRCNLFATASKDGVGNVTVVDEDGVEYRYDSAGTPIIAGQGGTVAAAQASVAVLAQGQGIVWTKKFGTVYRFQREISPGTAWRLSEVSDRHGNRIVYTYNDNHFPVLIADARHPEVAIACEYNEQGRLRSITGPRGTFTFAYEGDPGRFLKSITAPEVPVVASVDPEAAGDPAPVVMTRPATQFSYEQIKDEKGKDIYALAGVIDPGGNAFSFTYQWGPTSEDLSDKNSGSLVLAGVSTVDGGASFAYEDWKYDHVATAVTDTRGHIWRYEFDEPVLDAGTWLLRRQVRIAPDEAGSTCIWRFALDRPSRAVNLVEVIDQHGIRQTFEYGRDEDYDYARWGDVHRETLDADGLKIVREFGYDQTWHVMNRIVSPRGFEKGAKADDFATTYEIDAASGNRLAEHGPEGRTLRFAYDDPDAPGMVSRETDADGRVTLHDRTYSPSGWTDTTRVTGYGGELNLVTSRTYTWGGDAVQGTDANGNATDHVFDALGYRLASTLPSVFDSATGQEVRPVLEYRRDANRQVVGECDPLGRWTLHRFDGLYRRIESRHLMPGDNDLVSTRTFDTAGNLAEAIDPNGNVVTYMYDPLNRMVAELVDNPRAGEAGQAPLLITRREYGKNCGNDVFAANGFVPTLTVDRSGIVDEVEYDAAGRPVRQARAETAIASRTYDAAGNLVREIRHNLKPPKGKGSGNQEVLKVYDPLDRVVHEVVDMEGAGANVNHADDLHTLFAYDRAGHVVTQTDPARHSTQSEYDGAGRLVKQVVNLDDNPAVKTVSGNSFVPNPSPDDIVSTTAYDGNGNKLAVTLVNDTAGGSGVQVTTSVYDALNRPVSVTDPEGFTATAQYDLAGNKVVAVDQRGFRTDITYDHANRLVATLLPEVADAENGGAPTRPRTTLAYDRNGNRIRETDARGLVTEHVFDSLNREVRTAVDPAGINVVTTTAHDPNGNPVRSVFRRGDADLTTETEYDEFNRPTKVTQVVGSERFTEGAVYDTVGNKVAAIDKRGNRTDFAFDRANRQTQILLPLVDCYAVGDGNPQWRRPTTVTTYLKNGWAVAVTDANGNTATTTYDAAGRKTRITNAEGENVDCTYDKAGNILAQTVVNKAFSGDQKTAFSYDRRNLLLAETLMSGHATLSRTTAYTYDAVGNKVTRTFPDTHLTTYAYDALSRLTGIAYAGAVAQNRSFTYNLNGAAIQVTDPTGKTLCAYDRLGRNRTETKTDPAGVVLSVVTNTYDKAGNRVAVTHPNGRSLASRFDRRNLLVEVRDGIRSTLYGYDKNGSRTSLTLPNGLVTTTTFDAAGRNTGIVTTGPGGETIHEAAYRLDFVGNRVGIVESRADVPASRTLLYTYDKAYRLLTESDDLTGVPVVTTYAYDDAGNRIAKSGTDILPVSYKLDQLNRVVSFKQGSATTFFTYNPNGCRTYKERSGLPAMSYSYDRENRLTQVRQNATPIFAATYDYRTRRISCVENGVDTRYVYDGGDCIQERDPAGSLTRQLIRGSSMGGGIGGILYAEDGLGGNQEFFAYNALGSTVALADGVGTVTSTTDYEAFGKTVAESGATGESRKFCTKERSATIGLDNFGFRYYDPDLGRFLTRDPAGYPNGPNNYLYCSNNPVNQIDPLGLASKWWKDFYTAVINPVEMVKQVFEDVKTMSPYKDNDGRVTLGGPAWDAVSDAVFHPGKVADQYHSSLGELIYLTGAEYNLWKNAYNQENITGKVADYARISSDVYNNEGAPKGWSRLSEKDLKAMGLDPEMFYSQKDGKSGFYAALYKNNETSAYVLAFRGTHDLNDWKTDFKQALGRETEQYDKAVTLAQSVKNAMPEQSGLVMTGHSLGGGLASVTSLRTGTIGITFNPAGVHKNTMARHNLDPSKGDHLVSPYIVKGEILDHLQSDHVIMKRIMPPAVGTPKYIEPNGPYLFRTQMHLNSAIEGTFK